MGRHFEKALGKTKPGPAASASKLLKRQEEADAKREAGNLAQRAVGGLKAKKILLQKMLKKSKLKKKAPPIPKRVTKADNRHFEKALGKTKVGLANATVSQLMRQ